METGMDSAVWGFIGTLVGAATSLAGTWLNNSQGSKLEDRRTRDARIEHAKEFQRTTLIALQDELNESARTYTTIATEAGVAELKNEARNFELTNKLVSHIGSLHVLSGRIVSDELRYLLGQYIAELTKFFVTKNEAELSALVTSLQPRFVVAVNSVSTQLRMLYEPIPR